MLFLTAIFSTPQAPIAHPGSHKFTCWVKGPTEEINYIDFLDGIQGPTTIDHTKPDGRHLLVDVNFDAVNLFFTVFEGETADPTILRTNKIIPTDPIIPSVAIPGDQNGYIPYFDAMAGDVLFGCSGRDPSKMEPAKAIERPSSPPNQ